MNAPDEKEIEELIAMAIRNGQELDPRTQQANEGRLGPSDIGFCRQKAALMTRGIKPTDSKPLWAAGVGTAVHNYVEKFITVAFPSWLIEDHKVTASLPRSGAEISGTPDIIVPNKNLILDIKTVDGFETVKRYGPSLNHRYQRHLYALGAIQERILDGSQQVYVGNVYLDRSGRNPRPFVTIEPMDDSLTEEIDSWVEDVIYAVKMGEDANRDIAPAVCEKICNFYTVCRGGLPVDESEPITDPNIVQAIDLYVEGRTMEKAGKDMKREAQAVLDGINGSDGRFQVRWVTVSETQVEGFTRPASKRLDVRAVRRK